MKPCQSISFLVLFLIAAFNSKAQVLVYNNVAIIGKLNDETSKKECGNCYYREDITLFNKSIKIKIPVMIENMKFQTERFLEITDKGKIKILKFNSVSDGSSNWLYLQNKGNKIYIIRKLSYNNAVYKKEIKKNDFDYLPATEVCTRDISELINEEISFTDLFRFFPADCYKCPIKTDVNNCIKNGRVKYSW